MIRGLIPTRWHNPIAAQLSNNVGLVEMAAVATAVHVAGNRGYSQGAAESAQTFQETFQRGLLAYEQTVQTVVDRPLASIGAVAATLLGAFALMTAKRVLIDDWPIGSAIRDTFAMFRFWR